MLRTRLTLGLLPLLLLFFLVSLYATRTSQQLGSSVQEILAQNFESIRSIQRMRETVASMSDVLAAAARGPAPELAGRFAADRSVFMQKVNDELLARPDPEKTALLNILDGRFRNFADAGAEQLRLGRLPALPTFTSSAAAVFSINETLNALLEREHQDILSAELALQKRINHALGLTAVAAIVAVGLFFYLSWRLANSLLRPIQALTTSAVAVGQGQLDQEVLVNSRDELGQLATAFNTMSTHLRRYREAMQAKVLRTQRTMEATLTSAPDPVFVVERGGAPEVRNPAAEALLSSPDFAEGFPPPLEAALQAVLTTGKHYLPTDYGCVLTVRVGRGERHYLPRILAIGDKLTEFTGAAIVLQDVTKFRLLDDAKTNLVGTVSHELKTPLTSLRLAIYLLLEQTIAGLSATQRELLEGVRDDADRLLQILDDLLDLARLEAGAATLELRQVSVSTLVGEVSREAQSLVASGAQSLYIRIPPEVAEIRIAVDGTRLRHVFINLLTNAAKYSPAHSTIAVEVSLPGDGFVRFAVLDEGPGIPEASSSRIFERFYRVPGTTKSGAGLGLAIAREVVVAHGGTIGYTRRAEGGSEFYILLPVATEPA